MLDYLKQMKQTTLLSSYQPMDGWLLRDGSLEMCLWKKQYRAFFRRGLFKA
jgi:hypothetical protein